MTEVIDIKKNFIENFQKKIIQGRKLLTSGNHSWADKLFNDLYFDIEKIEWMDIQKKSQLIMVIVNSWHIYINSLRKKNESGVKFDPIKYLDAYNRFFTFLSKLDDFYHFSLFFTNLLKSFIKMDNISQIGITKFINSFCNHVYNKGNYLDLIELQILLMYLRKSVLPTNLFIFSMENLSKIVIELKPDKRPLFINIFLENISIRYNLIDGGEFVKLISKLLVNRLPSSLKNEFGKLTRVSINERIFPSILNELEELIHYLYNIGEHSWIIMVIRYMYSKINEFQSFPDAINYIRKYIDFLINRSQFEVAFSIYDFMEDLFIYKSDLGYSNILIELWIEACNKFINIKEKKYLLQSLSKVNTHLKIPRTNEEIFHFFHTCNYLWQFKSLYYSLEPGDFWRMLFYRALFEENDFHLSSKIIPFLDKNLQASLSNLPQLHEETQSLKSNIYSFDEGMNNIEPNFKISKLILYINSKGLISYRLKSNENILFEGKIMNEYWNDSHISDIYEDLFSLNQAKKYNISITEFGKIYYLSLPKLIRNVINQFNITEEGEIPQIFVILDSMTIPFELIYHNNFFLFQYSISYQIGELNIGGIPFESQGMKLDGPKDVLVIEAINDSYPTKWNEKKQVKELIFPFIEGKDELNHVVTLFKTLEKINSMKILTESTCTRETILSQLSQGKLDIIHFIGNIYYSKTSPKDSYFMTNDKNIIKIEEVSKAISFNSNDIYPLIFFDAQVFNDKGEKVSNATKILGEIFSNFDFNRVKGIITRNLPIFRNESRKIIADFYSQVLNKNNLGIALLKALSEDLSKTNIENHQSAILTSFILFGRPWNVL